MMQIKHVNVLLNKTGVKCINGKHQSCNNVYKQVKWYQFFLKSWNFTVNILRKSDWGHILMCPSPCRQAY